MPPVEYAVSGRSTCKVCSSKITKGALRIGKTINVDTLYGGKQTGTAWHHFSCFWNLRQQGLVWSSFSGISSLRLQDQQELHVRVTGRPMEQNMVEAVTQEQKKVQAEQEEEAKIRKEEAAEVDAVYTNSSPQTIIYTMLQKHLDLLKVPELKAACLEHGLVLDKKAKRANIVKLIMDQKIEKVSGLAYHGLKKHCKAQDLKANLKAAALPVSGTKEDLIRRLLQSQGAGPPTPALVSASQAIPKAKKRAFSWDEMDGEYKRDEEDSNLVQVARSGSLVQLEELLAKLPAKEGSRVQGPGFGSRAAVLNHARRWTEVEEKWGYDKSWEWFGDTALIAAARRGEAGKVKALLLAGADPTLDACPRDDVNEDATKAAIAGLRRAKAAIKEVEEGKLTSAHQFLGAREAAVKLLETQARATSTVALVQLATSHWTKASYASQTYSDNRKNGFVAKPNSPRDPDKLYKELSVIDVEAKVVQEKKAELEQLSASIEGALQKKKIEVHAEKKNMQYASFQKQSLPAGVFHFQGSAGQGASKRPHLQTGQESRQCQGGCDRLPAGTCTQKRCARCCRGPCGRHAK